MGGFGVWVRDPRGLPEIDLRDYGSALDGSTDNTSALTAALADAVTEGGARILVPGHCIVDGPLLDTGNANAQILLPEIEYSTTAAEGITIELRGAFAPHPVPSVTGTIPTPDNHSIIESTLTTGNGSLLCGRRAASMDDFTNVHLRLTDINFRMPANPTNTALDLSTVATVDLDNVMVDAGEYQIESIAEPTTPTSYGIKLPGNNNGAFTRLGAVNVIGFYTGYQFAEHTVGQQVNAWGCKQAAQFLSTSHASKFERLMTVHCQRGLVGPASGNHYVDIDQFNIEHAASGWWAPVYDIDDSGNRLHGTVRWHVVLAFVGIDDTFLTNGAANLQIHRVGAAVGSGGGAEYRELAMTGSGVTLEPVTNTTEDDWLYGVFS